MVRSGPTETDPVLAAYARRLRRSLAGLPPADVDHVVDETLSSLRSQTDEGIAILKALKAVGAPHLRAAEVIEERVRPADGTPVSTAPPARRALGWLVDAAIGWGPLAVAAAWLLAGSPSSVPALLAAATFAWGLWYWFALRRRSASVGMRSAGLSRVRASDRRVTVRTSELARAPRPR